MGYNWDWFFRLVLSVIAATLLTVGLSAVFHRRHHNPLRTISEFLSRHQIGYIGYYGALLLTLVPPGQFLPYVLLIAMIISVVLAVFGAQAAAPTYQEAVLKEAHTCPTTTTLCDQNVPSSVQFKLWRRNLLLSGISLVIAVTIPFWPRHQVVAEKPPRREKPKSVSIQAVLQGSEIDKTPKFVQDQISYPQGRGPDRAVVRTRRYYLHPPQ